jgi:hypothetical protein
MTDTALREIRIYPLYSDAPFQALHIDHNCSVNDVIAKLTTISTEDVGGSNIRKQCGRDSGDKWTLREIRDVEEGHWWSEQDVAGFRDRSYSSSYAGVRSAYRV